MTKSDKIGYSISAFAILYMAGQLIRWALWLR